MTTEMAVVVNNFSMVKGVTKCDPTWF
jgi:hypothetical protein